MTDVDFTSSTFPVYVRTPRRAAADDQLLEDLNGGCPRASRIVVDTTYGDEIDAGSTGPG